MGSYENLEVWKKAHEFVIQVYKETASFPIDERYGITSQLRRAATSIPTNIAEGKGSQYHQKMIRYLDIARASAHEVEYLLLLCRDIGYLSNEIHIKLRNDCIEILKMLTNFMKKMQKQSN